MHYKNKITGTSLSLSNQVLSHNEHLNNDTPDVFFAQETPCPPLQAGFTPDCAWLLTCYIRRAALPVINLFTILNKVFLFAQTANLTLLNPNPLPVVDVPHRLAIL